MHDGLKPNTPPVPASQYGHANKIRVKFLAKALLISAVEKAEMCEGRLLKHLKKPPKPGRTLVVSGFRCWVWCENSLGLGFFESWII